MSYTVYKSLPIEIERQVDDLLTAAGDASRRGDFLVEEKFSLKAWDLLPEPKLGWDYYSNILPRDNLIFYRNTKQFEKAQRWLEITRESYGPERDDAVEFIAATLWYAMGEEKRAFDEFSRQFDSWGHRAFQDEDPKYLKFYMEARKRYGK